jgi:glycosyltransferase involved in cell wall biosynthesis
VVLPTASRSGPSRPLHVLTLTPFYPTNTDDAAGCFVYEPLLWTSKFGICNTVFAAQPFYRGGKIESDRFSMPAQWIRYFAIPGGLGLPSAGAFLFAQTVGRLREMQREHRIDLIHAHGALPCGHAAMLLSRELGIPFVVSVHGLDAYSTVQVGGRSGKWCRRISQRTYIASRRVICISEHVREQVLEGVGRSCRTSVVHNGVDTDLFSPSTEPPTDPPVILSVGNLIPIKGHVSLIRAVASLKSDFPSLVLEIIGRGPEQPRLKELVCKLELADSVRIIERRSRRATAAAMRRCTIFALPSRYEGLGCVYLEAMSTGKPVIGCRGQGIAEIIQQGSNGFLVGPDNEKELAVAISMLLRDETRRKNLGIAARDTIVGGLTLAHQAEKFVRIYRECAG